VADLQNVHVHLVVCCYARDSFTNPLLSSAPATENSYSNKD